MSACCSTYGNVAGAQFDGAGGRLGVDPATMSHADHQIEIAHGFGEDGWRHLAQGHGLPFAAPGEVDRFQRQALHLGGRPERLGELDPGR